MSLLLFVIIALTVVGSVLHVVIFFWDEFYARMAAIGTLNFAGLLAVVYAIAEA